MWLFKMENNKGVNNYHTASMRDKVAGKIAGAGMRVQRKFAEGMNKLFEGMNAKKLKVFLVLFCLCAGGYSIYLAVNAITGADRKQRSFTVDQVDVPKHFNKTGDEIMTEAYVDEATIYKIQGFKIYLDSLKQNKSKQYDSILHARPNLMDSVQVLEELYYSQKQK